MNASKNEKLKVGFILNNHEVSLRLLKLIDKIKKSDFVSTYLFITSPDHLTINESNPPLKHIFYILYSKLESKRDSREKMTPLELSRYQELVNQSNEIQINFENPESRSIEEIKTFDLDVLLNLTDQKLSKSLSEVTKAGIWSIQYCNPETRMQTSPLGFWEIYDNTSLMENSLIAEFSDSSQDKVLSRIVYATDIHCSAELNRDNAYIINNSIVFRNLEKLYTLGVEAFLFKQKKLFEKDRISHDPSRFGEPGNLQMISFLIKKLFNSLKMRVMNRLFVEQWAMRYKLSKDKSMDFSLFEKLIPWQDGLWADPFIFYHESNYYLFFEDAIYDKENADISVMRIGENGSRGEPQPCLVRPYHLSYPFVFFWEGEHYMIPETKSNKAIEVYRATSFPDEWLPHTKLMEDIEAVDTTLLFRDNKWWLFTSIKPERYFSINNELSIFYADSPLSKNWTPHPMNPVISDVRKARPAGRIYEHEGKLIRPSQDSSVRYGYGLRLNEIVTLTETVYEEKEIDFIEPTWGKMLRGIHTIAHEKNLTVIDVLEWRFRFF